MKKYILFVFLIIFSFKTRAQHSCCVPSVNSVNTAMAMNDEFAAKHLAPEPFILNDQKGTMISFKTMDTLVGLAYLVKAEKPSDKYLFIFHEWWGLNDYIKKEADQYAKDLPGVNVIALDLYDGRMATDRQTAQKLAGGLKEERARSIMNGLLGYVGKKAQIASIGWCMGGSWSLQSALLEKKQAIGCVMYYGMPEASTDKLKKLNCDVLGVFATQDKFISPQVVTDFETHMKEAGKKITVYNYEADHAFANPSNPKHNKEFADDARTKALAFLKEKLKV